MFGSAKPGRFSLVPRKVDFLGGNNGLESLFGSFLGHSGLLSVELFLGIRSIRMDLEFREIWRFQQFLEFFDSQEQDANLG